MEIVKFLEETAIESIKADAAFNAIRKNIQSRVNNLTYSKCYKDKFMKDGMEYEFYKSFSNINEWHLKEKGKCEIEISFLYFCISKLPKIKREKIERQKRVQRDISDEICSMTHDSAKPLWYSFQFTVDIREALYEDLDFNCRPK